MTKKRILIMAGGTGGHIFPALAVAKYLKEQGVDVAFLGTAHGLETVLVPKHHFKLFSIGIRGVRRAGMKRWLLLPFTLARAVLQARKVIKTFRPDKILGMGGFASGPGGLAAFLLWKPLILHEQNSVPGLTNKILSRVATQVFEAFPDAFPAGKKVNYVGNPVRSAIASMPSPRERLTQRTGPLRIVVLGGSRGAMALNVQVPQALALLTFPVEVRHQCGATHVESAKQVYREAKFKAEITPFFNDMKAVYEWADFLICRSGAMTVSELSAAGVPAVFVPFPYAVDDHQTKNADFLVQAQAAQLLQQEELTPECLAKLITKLNDRQLLLTMADNAYCLRKVEATEQVAQVLMS